MDHIIHSIALEKEVRDLMQVRVVMQKVVTLIIPTPITEDEFINIIILI